MRFHAIVFAASLLATNAFAAPTVLLESPVRVAADVVSAGIPGIATLELSVVHGGTVFVLKVAHRGSVADALAKQKTASGWKDGFLFIRDDCRSDDPATAAWRCIVDHVFALSTDDNDQPGTRLIYVGDVFAGEQCIESLRIGCALYKGVFTDIYDRLETNPLVPRGESPALLIESRIRSGTFEVDLDETWRANQERFLAGQRCVDAKPEMRRERCIDGITPRGAYLFNTALATYVRQNEPLARIRAFARAALCESGRERLSDNDCSDTLRASALMLAGIRPGDKPRRRGNVMSRPAELAPAQSPKP